LATTDTKKRLFFVSVGSTDTYNLLPTDTKNCFL
jgi:hypothetical protein